MSILTVSEINRYISFGFKNDPNLRGKFIQGEISNFTHHLKTGHFYFTLKDSESSIKAIMFKSYAQSLHFIPENGMSVIAFASVQVFERDGVYQLYVTDMQPSGVGALYLAFEQLKEKLSKQGLFDEKHKLPIPKFPRKIGIITAKTGAALQDILNILKRRYPLTEVLVFSALVQGKDAPQSICNGILSAQTTDCDVLILARGGGSLEDLSAFNTEEIAAGIFNSKIPIISAVGHETDTTIADFVADLRAPTPSAAAELATPEKLMLLETLENYEVELFSGVQKNFNAMQKKIDDATNRLNSLSIEHKVDIYTIKLNKFSKELSAFFCKTIAKKQSELDVISAKLSQLSPSKILALGYSMAYKNGLIATSVKQFSTGDELLIKFSDGEALVKVDKVKLAKEKSDAI